MRQDIKDLLNTGIDMPQRDEIIDKRQHMQRVVLTFITDSNINDTLHRIADQEEKLDIIELMGDDIDIELDNSLQYIIGYESYYIDKTGRKQKKEDNEYEHSKFGEKLNHLGLTKQEAEDIKAFIDSITYKF